MQVLHNPDRLVLEAVDETGSVCNSYTIDDSSPTPTPEPSPSPGDHVTAAQHDRDGRRECAIYRDGFEHGAAGLPVAEER